MSDDKTCPACWEEYTTVKRKKIQCPKCTKYSCVVCLKQSIKEQGITNICPILNCSFEWTVDFIRDNFPKSFVDGELKEKKKQLYLAREKTFLPAAMEELERIKFIDKLRRKQTKIMNKNATIRDKINSKTNKLVRELTQEYNNQVNNIRSNARSEITEQSVPHKDLDDIIWLLQNNKDIPIDVVGENYNDASHIREYLTNKNISIEKEVETKSRYIYPCGTNDCNGFLNNKYKCGICNYQFCSQCFGRLEKDDEHTCKEEDIASATLIKNSTKPCPNCHTRIFKISGCDQMWCTFCHVAFSWNKGTIEKGRIHNPEYTNYMLSKGGDVNATICNGQAPPLHTIFRALEVNKVKLNNITEYTIDTISRTIDEMRQYTLANYSPNETKHKELRFAYIRKNINDVEYKSQLIKFERLEVKHQRIHDYLDTFTKGATDLLINLHARPTHEQIKIFMTEIIELIKYVNEHLKNSITKLGYKSYPMIYVNPLGYIIFLKQASSHKNFERTEPRSSRR